MQNNDKLLLELFSMVKDIKKMQEQDHASMYNIQENITDMSKKVDYLYNLSLDNYGEIEETKTRVSKLEDAVFCKE